MRITIASVLVDDQAKALDFYTRVMEPTFAVFVPPALAGSIAGNIARVSVIADGGATVRQTVTDTAEARGIRALPNPAATTTSSLRYAPRSGRCLPRRSRSVW